MIKFLHISCYLAVTHIHFNIVKHSNKNPLPRSYTYPNATQLHIPIHTSLLLIYGFKYPMQHMYCHHSYTYHNSTQLNMLLHTSLSHSYIYRIATQLHIPTHIPLLQSCTFLHIHVLSKSSNTLLYKNVYSLVAQLQMPHNFTFLHIPHSYTYTVITQLHISTHIPISHCYTYYGYGTTYSYTCNVATHATTHYAIANIHLPGSATCCQVNLICDSKIDNLCQQHFKYLTVNP